MRLRRALQSRHAVVKPSCMRLLYRVRERSLTPFPPGVFVL